PSTYSPTTGTPPTSLSTLSLHDALPISTAAWFTARAGSVRWLLAGLWADFDRKPFKRAYPSGTIELNLTVSERVQEYREKLNERSEEHTSELQSRSDLVCRLLLEKKKDN